MPANRTATGRKLSRTAFKKGQSGNPSGRPKRDAELQAMAREHTKEALETAVKIMQDGAAPAASRMTAVNTILERGWGKAPQTIKHEGLEALLAEADDMLLDRMAKRAAAVMGLTGDASVH